jgi:hypothetical protein
VSAAIPSVTRQRLMDGIYPQSLTKESSSRHASRAVIYSLTAICGVQTVLSLTLVWSNTAFADEAQYITAGELEWAHWLHGASMPPFFTSSFSGSPMIYPPIGAIANNIGGIAGSRILSLVFMLLATILLYLTAARLFDRTTATVAAALWAFSEPAIRLAFATFDPFSVLLTALSAWLVVQVGYHRRRGVFVTAAAAALALANAAAYSGIVIDPIVIVFAFLVWLQVMPAWRAVFWTTSLTGVLAAFFGLLMTLSGSWVGLMSTIFNRSGSDHQSVLLVLYDSWGYSGLLAVLAVIGVIIACGVESKQRAALLALLGVTALVVPAAQLHQQTAWSLDKHLAYGIWFSVMAAGYACGKLIQRLPGAGRKLALLFCVIALIYPAANSWNAAWKVYQAWPDARSFVAAFAPIAAHSGGLIDVSETGPENVAEYYTPQGREWKRWSTALSLDPASVRQSAWESYYAGKLQSGKFGVIALFYSTTFSSAPGLPGNLLLPPRVSNISQELLGLVADNSGEPGLTALTLAVEDDPNYSLVVVGPYDSDTDNGVYAIWQEKAGT